MIQANELRIGNWLLFEGEYRKVGGIDVYGTISFQNEGKHSMDGTRLELCWPVPLTWDIIEKSGLKFRKGLEDFFIKVGDNSILILQPNQTKVCVENQRPSVFRPTLCLHKLQNLYFTLTGEELQFSL